MNIPVFFPHPLRAKLQEYGITLSQLRATMQRPISESRLSYYLGSRRPMPTQVEQAIREALIVMGVPL